MPLCIGRINAPFPKIQGYWPAVPLVASRIAERKENLHLLEVQRPNCRCRRHPPLDPYPCQPDLNWVCLDSYLRYRVPRRRPGP